jgi:hypothetical protein
MRDSIRLGVAWIMMWMALAVHVTDEALTGFLSVYNPTVLALRAKLGYWPVAVYALLQLRRAGAPPNRSRLDALRRGVNRRS